MMFDEEESSLLNDDKLSGNSDLTDNIVVFPSGNWMTNKLYYNSSKEEYRQLDLNQSVTMEEIENNNEYAEKLIKISNGIITYDLIKAYETGKETVVDDEH